MCCMKQFLVFILAFLYLGSSAGAMVHLHYCKGELVDVQVGEKEKKSCSGCKSEKKKSKPCMKNCCKDEHRMMKIEKDHQQSGDTQFKFVQSFSYTCTYSFFEIPPFFAGSEDYQLPFTHGPPLPGPVLLHVLHCHFRI